MGKPHYAAGGHRRMQAGQKQLGRPPIEAALLSPGAVGTRPVDVVIARQR